MLVEKPLALNAAQAAQIAERAAQRGVFCMEALWTFSLPTFDVIRQLLDDGVLGDVHTVLADHGEWFPADAPHPAPPSWPGARCSTSAPTRSRSRSWVLGEPEQILAIGQDVPGGEVHGQVSAVLRHPGGAQAAVNTTVMADTPNRAVLAGTRATLVVEAPFFAPGDLVLTSAGKESTLRYTEPAIGHEGLFVTAVEVARRIAAGETGTPLRPLADSVATLRVVDEVRRQIGVTFLEETAPGVPR